MSYPYPGRQLPPLPNAAYYNRSALPSQFGGNWLARGGQPIQNNFRSPWWDNSLDRGVGVWRLQQYGYGQAPDYGGLDYTTERIVPSPMGPAIWGGRPWW